MAQVASCRTFTAVVRFWFRFIAREIYGEQRDSGRVLRSSAVFVIQQYSIVYWHQKDMRTNSGNLHTKRCSFRYRGALNMERERERKKLSLRGFRSRLFDSHKCWLPPTKNQRPVACPITARYMWPSRHAELWVSHFEPESDRHTVEGTTRRLQRRDNWGQLHLNSHSASHDIHRLSYNLKICYYVHNSPSLQQMDTTQLISFKMYFFQRPGAYIYGAFILCVKDTASGYRSGVGCGRVGIWSKRRNLEDKRQKQWQNNFKLVVPFVIIHIK